MTLIKPPTAAPTSGATPEKNMTFASTNKAASIEALSLEARMIWNLSLNGTQKPAIIREKNWVPAPVNRIVSTSK